MSTVEKTFKFSLFVICIVLLVVYYGHLKENVRIPYIMPE